MTTLVTGAAGFIGFHLCRLLATRGHRVVGIDSLNDYYDPVLKRARLLELGIGTAAADLGRLTGRGNRLQRRDLQRQPDRADRDDTEDDNVEGRNPGQSQE